MIGSDQANPVVLTACEWMDVFVDQLGQVRRGVLKNSYWELLVDQPGEYEFELRHWPHEIDIALRDKPEGGVALPISAARIFISGVDHGTEKKPFSFEGERKNVRKEDRSAIFTVQIEACPVTLHTWFDDQNNQAICGAYYVYVRRKQE